MIKPPVLLAILGISASLAQQPAQEPAQEPSVFRSGTRLVEVDVVVRDKHGPVTGLTKDDFTLLDCKSTEQDTRDPLAINSICKGKQQVIAVFHASSAQASTSGATPAPAAKPLPAGVVSNTINNHGEPVSSATVLLLDQLNTSFDLKEYARNQIAEYLKSVQKNDRVAVYSLGKTLHVLEDFTDDPQKLIQAVTKLDSGLDLLRQGVPGAREMFDQITVGSLKKIVQHLSGVSGRKNLIWVKENPSVALSYANSRTIMTLLREANVAVYPVLVRSLQPSGALNIRASRRTPPPVMADLGIQKRARDLGVSLGGTGFGDVRDIGLAVRTAQEDSRSGYVLGFYPAEADLDGELHQLSVTLTGKPAKSGLEVHFRKEYLATQREGPAGGAHVSLEDLFADPLDATGIGLTGAADSEGVDVAVSLAQVHLELQGDRWVGLLQAAAQLEPSTSAHPTIQTMSISLTQEELKAARDSGFIVRQQIPKGKNTGVLHIVIQDIASGATGSLRVPLGKHSD